LFKNARVITATGVHSGEVLVREGVIAQIALGSAITAADTATVDAGGLYLSPGFIDVHTHGAGGADFMDGTLDAIYLACKTHLAHGTTSIVPTTVAGSASSLLEFVELFNRVELEREGMPHILGLHLEGPYFAYEQRGAQDPRYLRNPDPAEYEEVLRRTDRILRWSFAVELEGSQEFLQFLRRHGIVSSLAHSDATYEQVARAHENGMAALAHFYSGMSGVRRVNAYRVAGAVEAGYLLDGLLVEVIADGKHLPAELLRLIYKVKGARRICLVTDSMRAAGMPDGSYKLGNLETGLDTIVEDGVAKLPDRSAFAGSVATADRLVRTMRGMTGAPLHEVVNMASLNPARLVGADSRKGSVALGKDADLLLFDEDINISRVMVAGKFIE
jgi:N-acetylglucosamine-6-phosphate deacetylase